jgi:dCTP deaminase
MTVLCKSEILAYLEAGKIVINPFNPTEQVGAVSIDLRLGYQVGVFKMNGKPYIDVKNMDLDRETTKFMIDEKKGLTLHPHELYLGLTLENVALPNNLVGHLNGRSSLARVGVTIDVTADRVDPGWAGNLTLEIVNIGRKPVIIYPGMKIAALELLRTSRPTAKYDGKYLGATTLLPSRIGREFQAELGLGNVRRRSKTTSHS